MGWGEDAHLNIELNQRTAKAGNINYNFVSAECCILFPFWWPFLRLLFKQKSLIVDL